VHEVIVTSATAVEIAHTSKRPSEIEAFSGAGARVSPVKMATAMNAHTLMTAMQTQSSAMRTLAVPRKVALQKVQIFHVKKNWTKRAGRTSKRGCKVPKTCDAPELESARMVGFPHPETRNLYETKPSTTLSDIAMKTEPYTSALNSGRSFDEQVEYV